jgi:hypothetical protein
MRQMQMSNDALTTSNDELVVGKIGELDVIHNPRTGRTYRFPKGYFEEDPTREIYARDFISRGQV